MNILLAEDDLELAEYLIAGLGEHGHSVDHVTDGRDALSYCLYNDCDIAIVDRIMAGMDDLCGQGTSGCAQGTARSVPVGHGSGRR